MKQNGETKTESIKICYLKPSPTNPRKHFVDQEIADLAKSIAEKGVLAPLMVRGNGLAGESKEYEIIAGEKRYKAAKKAGLEAVPCIVRNDLTDQQVLEIQIVENCQRSDLTPLEEAKAYQELHDKHKYDWPELAAKLAKDQRYIYNRLKLLTLIPEFQTAMTTGEIECETGGVIVFKMTWAEQIIRVANPEEQKKLYKDIKDNEWKYSDLESLIDVIQDEYLLQLKNAPFSTTDETLAGGPCGKCAKRTGANPTLFGELASKADTCQDAACWAAKKKEFEKKTKAKYQKQVDAGHEVIVGDAAEKILKRIGNCNTKYVPFDEKSYELKGQTTWDTALKGIDFMATYVVNAKGVAKKMVNRSEALKLIPAAMKNRDATSSGRSAAETTEQLAKRKAIEEAAAAKRELEKKAAEDALKQITPDLLKKINDMDFNKSNFLIFLLQNSNLDTSSVPEVIAEQITEELPEDEKTAQKCSAKILKQAVVLSMIENYSDFNCNDGLNKVLDLAGLLQKFKQTMKDNLEKASVKKGTCRVCGCTEDTPCMDKKDGTTCSWTDKTETLCTGCRTKDKKKGKSKK